MSDSHPVSAARRRATCLWAALFLVSTLLLSLPRDDEGESGQSFLSDGTEIHYQVEGRGDPVVLIHGFLLDGTQNWSGVLPHLGDGFQTITIDARGHGKSGKPHDPAAYGDQMAQDVINLLDHLKIKQAHIGGYSMGGFITLRLMELAPERFLTAIVAGAGGTEATADSSLFEELAASLEAGTGVTPLIKALTPADQEPASAEQLAMVNQMIMGTNDPLALAAVIRGNAKRQMSDGALEANKIPTLVVIGARDPISAGADAMLEIMGGEITSVRIEGADHMSALIDPSHTQQLGEAMRDFLIAACHCA